MTQASGEPNAGQQSERYERGWAKLAQVDGEAAEKVLESLAGIAPDLGRYIVEFGFGDVYSRPGLDLKSREIATVAALTAMGNAAPQLKVHINAALNVGVSKGEIVEILIQMVAYAGFPAALNAMALAKEVFATRVPRERLSSATIALKRLAAIEAPGMGSPV